jgi:hypothetical protein
LDGDMPDATSKKLTRGTLALAAVAAGFCLAPSAAGAGVLYDQTLNSAAPTLDGPNFSPSNEFASSSDRTADDFVVPIGEKWAIDEIDVAGILDGSPVDSKVNAYIYSDGSGKPGPVIFTELGITATNEPNYHVPLTAGPELGPGTYWVTIQKIIGSGPFWSWGTESVGAGSAAMWITTSGGPSCTPYAWHLRSSCFPGNPDQTFRLIGTRTDTDGVETTITKRPQNSTRKRKAKYKFIADEDGVTFECLLRGKGLDDEVKDYSSCTSPKTYRGLKPGKYRFKVRGIDAAGHYDFTPATDKFKVRK